MLTISELEKLNDTLDKQDCALAIQNEAGLDLALIMSEDHGHLLSITMDAFGDGDHMIILRDGELVDVFKENAGHTDKEVEWVLNKLEELIEDPKNTIYSFSWKS